MLTFYRKIRKSIVQAGSARKYLLYAVGEIALVVIGILIALQINTWSENRKLEIKEINLLEELQINLETNVINLQNDVTHQIYQAEKLNDVIAHLEDKRAYNDSLSLFLDVGMPAPDVTLTSSAFETLKSTGLELIRSDSLRTSIITLFEVSYPYLMQETKRLEDQMWPSVVLPLQQKHFKHMPDAPFIPTDYAGLLQDQEFINMLSFRLTMRTSSTDLKESAIQLTMEVISSIDRELSIRK
jgi:hypothetical protein